MKFVELVKYLKDDESLDRFYKDYNCKKDSDVVFRTTS